jgi:hypothetical protein
VVFVSLCYQLCCSLSLFEKISARCQTGSVTYEQVPPSSTPTMASETKTRIHGKPQIMDTTTNYSYLFSKLATVEHTLFFWEDSFISGHETQQICPPCAAAFVKARWPSCPQSVAGRVSRPSKPSVYAFGYHVSHVPISWLVTVSFSTDQQQKGGNFI